MPRAPKPSIKEIVARAVAETQPKRRPFFSAKSPGMWSVFLGIIVYAFTIVGNVNGCFQSKFTKEQQLVSSYEGVIQLMKGDSLIGSQLTRNYWIAYSWHKQDSLQAEQIRRDALDSLSDHRKDLEYLYRHSHISTSVFRGQ